MFARLFLFLHFFDNEKISAASSYSIEFFCHRITTHYKKIQLNNAALIFLCLLISILTIACNNQAGLKEATTISEVLKNSYAPAKQSVGPSASVYFAECHQKHTHTL